MAPQAGRGDSPQWVEAPGISLRVLSWLPENSDGILEPVGMISGWGSVFEGWRPLLSEAKQRPVFYIETRDKKCKVSRNVSKADFHGDLRRTYLRC